MAIKTLNYMVDIDGITPSTEQYAGTQGDHRVTKLSFALSNSLFSLVLNAAQNTKVMYRFDIYDGEGGVWSSDPKELLEANINVELEERHTRCGGKLTVYLVITALSQDNATEIELYSFPARLRLNNRPDGILQHGESYESMTSLSESAKSSAELARQNADTAAIKAEDAQNSANESKISSDAAASCVDKAEQLVLEALENIKVVDQSYNCNSSNAQSGKAVAESVAKCVPKKAGDVGLPFSSVVATNNSGYGDNGLPTDDSYVNIYAIGDEIGKVIESYTAFRKSIPRRDSNGNLFTGNPIDDEDCVNKKYVDEKIVKIANIDQTYYPESESAQSGKAVAEAINEIDDKKVNKILRSDVADISEYDSTPNRIPYLYSVLENNKQSLIKGSSGIVVSELAKKYEETNPELSEKILNGIIPQEAKQYLDPHTFVMRDGNCAVPCGLHTYDKDESGNIINSVLYYGAAVPQGYMRTYVYEALAQSGKDNKKYVDEKIDTKKITSIYASYKYEFDYNALYLLKSNSGNKDIEILDGDGKNVIGYKASYCLLILPKKTYQRTEYTATVDKKDRELDKVNCIFAGMTDKSALTTMDKIQMLQFEVDPTKKISVTPSSSGISIFKVAF